MQLARLTEIARSGKGNLLSGSVAAARAGATVGEMSLALEQVWGRHSAKSSVIKNVFRDAQKHDAKFEEAQLATLAFSEMDGRAPSLLVAKIGQDGHDRGQKVIASGFGDIGFDVSVGNLFATAQEVAVQAAKDNVHVVGLSSLAAGHLSHLPELKQALHAVGRDDILIVVGGVIPPGDVAKLLEMGAAAVFPPGTVVSQAALDVLEQLRARLGYAQRR